jgi:PadR family transcriptional regulator, regulatory protein PadR
MTLATLQVLKVFLDDISKPIYGLELIKLVGLPSGTVYPILARLERSGWIAGAWEEITASEAQRPRRRLYVLTGTGESLARQELDAQLRTLKLSVSGGHRHRAAAPGVAL